MDTQDYPFPEDPQPRRGYVLPEDEPDAHQGEEEDPQLWGILRLAADEPYGLRPQDVDRVMSAAHDAGVTEDFRNFMTRHTLQIRTFDNIKAWTP